MKVMVSTAIFCLLVAASVGFSSALASKESEEGSVPLFSSAEKRELERLKKPQQLVRSYREKLQRSAEGRFKDFLVSTGQQVKYSLAERWKDSDGYWESVDRAMLHYYFRRWLRREWFQLEREEMDFLQEE